MTIERTETDRQHDRDDSMHEGSTPPIQDGPAIDMDEGATTTADLARAGSEPSDPHGEEDQADDDADATRDTEGRTALFEEADASDYRARWQEVQTDFVDDPRQAVQRADALVAELMKRLAETFAAERSDLEAQWAGGGQASTEDLRVAMQRYRSFFDRLLSL